MPLAQFQFEARRALLARACGVALVAGLSHGPALASPQQHPHVEVELVSELAVAAPGRPVTVAVRLKPEAGWHSYWQNPGDSGLATRIDWQLPDGVQAGPIQWPFPHRESLGPLTNFGYADEHFLLTELALPAATGWAALELKAAVSWLVCQEICIPGSAELSLRLPFGEPAPSTWADAIAASRAAVPQPLPVPAQFAVVGQQFRLQLEAGEWSAAELAFYPLTTELVANAAEPQIEQGEQWVEVSLPVSEYFSAAPATMEAVLVLDERRAVQVQARRVDAGQLLERGDPATPFESALMPGTELSLAFALVLAFAGGLILNLMPCVFPVLSIKALALTQQSGHGATTRRAHGLLYTAGVLFGFLVLAALLLVLRSSGEALGWGFQLQSPGFVAVLACLMLVLGLALQGYWVFGTRIMGLGQGLTQAEGGRGAFFTGVLACVVATPCTGPFMGPAMGFALTQSSATALGIFLALGLGLAFPFLLLSWLPRLAAALPRPGAWMERFRLAMAFPLYATAIWLLWVLGRQLGVDAMALVLLAMLALVLAIALGQAAWPARPIRLLAQLLVLAGCGLALVQLPRLPPPQTEPQTVELRPGAFQALPYKPAALQALLQQGQPVLLNLTADWCLTCKVNERVALSSLAVEQALARHGVRYMKGDWTHRDPEITRLLERYGRSGVPLYLLYPGGLQAAPVVLPQLLTPGLVVAELEKL